MNALQALKNVGGLITDSHIIYTSGKHGSSYINKDALYPHTEVTSELCKQIAEHFVADAPEVVIAPVIGGVILSQWVAFHLSKFLGREVLSVYAEKSEAQKGAFVIKRGFEKILPGKRVLFVEDVINTGGSILAVLEATKPLNIKEVGLAALCNRGRVTPAALGVSKIFSLIEIDLEAFDPDQCPLCKKGIPFNTSVGKAPKPRSI